jgi:hypothetical protein
MCTTFHCLSDLVHPATIAVNKVAGVKALRIVRSFPRSIAAHNAGRADVSVQIPVNAVIYLCWRLHETKTE